MADFWSIAIGIGMTIVVCALAYGTGALVSWLTQPRHDASDEPADWRGIGDGGSSFIHNGHIK
jgi:hypothetical protein